jgi:hypothetical protein
MADYKNTDLYWSDDGDFILSANKDIEDTSTESFRSLIQGIKARLNFNVGEWPGRGARIGANLADFHGKPNTEATGNLIKSRIISELTKSGFIATADLFVDVFPISLYAVLAKIVVRTPVGLVTYNQRFSIREEAFGKKGEV